MSTIAQREPVFGVPSEAEFCRASLTEEYALLCRQLTGTLARKRPSPFLRARADTWPAPWPTRWDR